MEIGTIFVSESCVYFLLIFLMEEAKMKQISVVGYPRIGANRELKKWTEGYFLKNVSKEDLLKQSADLRKLHWLTQKDSSIDYISSNDFSYYDTFLDMAVLLNVIPQRYHGLELDGLDTYFAMAKGYQGEKGDVRALPMKKWFNTNYHYVVPEIDDTTVFKLNGTKPFDEFNEALEAGIKTKPVLIGPFTFLKLSENKCANRSVAELAKALIPAYEQILERFDTLGADLVQIDEPCLVTDLAPEEVVLFENIYKKLLQSKGKLKILLQTYFGDVRDVYKHLVALDFDAIGFDFVEGSKNLDLIGQYGFPKDKCLFAGLVNGKNIWINHYRKTLALISDLEKYTGAQIVINTSCSLLHVPYTTENETQIDSKYRVHFAFAQEKLKELKELAQLADEGNYQQNANYIKNCDILTQKADVDFEHRDIRGKVAALNENDFIRKPSFEERRKIQKAALKLPLLPTTTIGSFPQTAEVRKLRRQYKNGEIDTSTYSSAIKKKIAEIIRFQEDIGLDILVHGEFERNDMVEYFGEKLAGFIFTKNAWVQSYGTRCVKPPIIFGDVKREKAMTVDVIKYAQSLTSKPVKGMLTGPVTILNWSFPREDLPRRDIAFQIAFAIKAEVEDLEANGIKIIQIDEAALREKLPLRKSEWHGEYLNWAIPAFRLVHSGVKPETQIHTHMCYSEFGDIIRDIDDMDADVITFEAAKSDLSLIGLLNDNHFMTEVGPGVYDIHSPRVPSATEIETIIKKIMQKLDISKLWVNPDCGLKTRGMEETGQSLENMLKAARKVRNELSK
jgi:5-methyltetrahydropteroyltriglutamate--homocysteine methyltransferase